MSVMPNPPSATPPSVGFVPGLKMGLIAAGVTSVANLLVWAVTHHVLGVSFLMPGPTGDLMPLHWAFVVIASSLPALAAPAILAFCLALSKGGGLRLFRIVAAVVLLLSFALPFAAGGPDADMATKVALNFMHLVSAAGVLRIVAVKG